MTEELTATVNDLKLDGDAVVLGVRRSDILDSLERGTSIRRIRAEGTEPLKGRFRELIGGYVDSSLDLIYINDAAAFSADKDNCLLCWSKLRDGGLLAGELPARWKLRRFTKFFKAVGFDFQREKYAEKQFWYFVKNPAVADRYVELVEQYSIVHKTQAYGAGKKLLPWIQPIVDFLKPGTILDYGCGQSSLVELLESESIEGRYRYDPAIEEYADFKKIPREVDLVMCTDVMEHIPEECLDIVLRKVRSFGESAIFVIHLGKARQVLPNGEGAHCTRKKREWWLLKLAHYYSTLELVPDLSQPGKFMCTTFLLE